MLAPRGPERDFFGPKGALPRFLLWKTGGVGIRSATLHWRLRCRDVAKASKGVGENPDLLCLSGAGFSVFCFVFFQFSGARGRKPQRQPGLHVEAPQQMASPDLAASCRGTRRWKALLSFIDWPGRTLWKPKGPKDNYCQPFSHSNLGNLIYTTSGEIPVSSTKNVSFHAHNKPVEAKQKDLKLTHLQS